MNQRPSGYEPDELPDCSTPRWGSQDSDPTVWSPPGRIRPLVTKRCPRRQVAGPRNFSIWPVSKYSYARLIIPSRTYPTKQTSI